MGLSDWIEERANSVQNFASGVASGVSSGVSAVAETVQSGIGAAAGTVGAAAQAMAERVGERASSIAGTVAAGASAVATGVQHAAAATAATAQARVGQMAANVQAGAAAVAARVQATAGNVAANVSGLATGIAGRVQTLAGTAAANYDRNTHRISGLVGTSASMWAQGVGIFASSIAGAETGAARFVDSLVQRGAAFVAQNGGPYAGAAAQWVAQRSATAAANVDRNSHLIAGLATQGAGIIAGGVGAGANFVADTASSMMSLGMRGAQTLSGRVATGVGQVAARVSGLVQTGAGEVAAGVGSVAGMAGQFVNGRIASFAEGIGARAATLAGGLGGLAGGVAGLVGKGANLVAGMVGAETGSLAAFLQGRVAAIAGRVSAGAARIAGRVGDGAHGIAGLLQQGMAFVSATTGIDIDALAARAHSGIEAMAQNARTNFELARGKAEGAALAALHAAQSVAAAVMDGPMGPFIAQMRDGLQRRAAEAAALARTMAEQGRKALSHFAALKAQAVAQAMLAKQKARETMRRMVDAALQHPMLGAARRGFDFAKEVGAGAVAWGKDKATKAAQMGRAVVGKGKALWAEHGPTIKAKARGALVGVGMGAGVGAGAGAIFGGPFGALVGGLIGEAVGAGIGLFSAGKAIENDGQMTGPFIPASFASAGKAKEWIGLSQEDALARGAAVFVNGVHTSAEKHAHSAQRLADETGTVVVGVWNATGMGQGPLGFARDWAQSLGDKMFGAGDNPAIAKMRWIIGKYGNAKENNGGLRILAHSQGSIIVSEALRQARDDGVNIKNNDVTTFGNAIYTVPEGAKYRHYVFSGDAISNSVGSVAPFSAQIGGAGELAGMRSAGRDTRVMAHPSWDPTRQHGLDENDGMPDYISATANTVRNDWAANPRWKGQGGFAGVPTKGPALPAAPMVSPYMVLRGGHVGAGGPTIGRRLQGWMPEFARSWFGGPDQGALDGGSAMPGMAKRLNAGVKVQRKGDGPNPRVDSGALLSRLLSAGGPGAALAGHARQRLAPALGFDPGGARIHVGPVAAQAARALGAEAFTIGSNVFFGAGRHNPTTAKGLGLLAHELTHVAQQTGGAAGLGSAAGMASLEAAAEEVGRIVEADLATGGASIGSAYVEVVGSAGEGQARRLDAISAQAVEEAQRRLETRPDHGAKIDELIVDVELDLDRMSDEECVSRWADAIVRAAEAKASRRGDVTGAASLQRKVSATRFQDEPTLDAVSEGRTVLKENDKGEAVVRVTTALSELGHYIVPTIDENYDPPLTSAVKSYQAAKGITEKALEGKVEQKTFGMLDADFSPASGFKAERDVLGKQKASDILKGTDALDAAERAAANRAMSTETPRTPMGLPPVFQPDLTGKGKYDDRLKAVVEREIFLEWTSMAKGRSALRGKAGSLYDATTIDPLGAEAGTAVKGVFGEYLSGRSAPALKFGVNVKDAWKEKEDAFAAGGKAAEDAAVDWRVQKILDGDSAVKALDREHGAIQSRPAEQAIVGPIKAAMTAKHRDKLIELHKAWPGFASGGVVFTQMFKGKTQGVQREQRWDFFQTFIHEYIHTLEHPDHVKYREGMDPQKGGFTLREGTTDYFTKIVWNSLAFGNALRARVEGPVFDASVKFVPPPLNAYDEAENAERLAGVVGVRNVAAAFFRGRVDLVGKP